MHRFFSVVVPFALVAGGCTPRLVSSTGPQTIRSASRDSLRGPAIGAGSRFTVRLDQTLDTLESERREQFTASVTQPLIDENGRVVVPIGARVRGRVQSVIGEMGIPRLRLHFDGIETASGLAPINVRVVASELQTYPGPTQYDSGPRLYDTWSGQAYGTYPGAYGGGPAPEPMPDRSGYGFETFVPREVRLPAGAAMQLVLTRPLLPPGATLSRR